MLVYNIDPIPMGDDLPLEQAFDMVFSPETIQRTHNGDMAATPLVDNRRRITYKVSLLTIPMLLRPYLPQPYIMSTMDQELHKHRSHWSVHTHIRFEMPMSNLITVYCKFLVYRKRGKTYFGGYMKHDLAMPSPIKELGEAYLAQHSRREVQTFEKTIREIYDP